MNFDRKAKMLVIGDTHMGSLSAPTGSRPFTFDTMSGEKNKYLPTRFQQKLNIAWKDMVDRVGKVDVCIVNGDLCDGVQKKSEGLNQWTTDKHCQAENCAQMLNMIKAKHFRITMGTAYHVDENSCLDEWVAKILKEKYHRSVTFSPHFIDEIEMNGEVVKRIHVSHKIGFSKSTWQYLTTPLARDLVLLKLNDSIKKYGKIGLAIRSHVHIYVEAGFSSTRGFSTFGWQGPTPFMISHNIVTPPEIGYVIVTVEQDGYLHVRPEPYPIEMPIKIIREVITDDEEIKTKTNHNSH